MKAERIDQTEQYRKNMPERINQDEMGQDEMGQDQSENQQHIGQGSSKKFPGSPDKIYDEKSGQETDQVEESDNSESSKNQ